MSEKYFVVSNSEKKILENEVDLILFIDSWTEKNSKDHFAAFESEEVIYIYEQKKQTISNGFLKYPSTIDLTYMTGGKPNEYLPILS